MYWLDLDSETWALLANFHLVWAGVFGIVAAAVRILAPELDLLLFENAVLVILFGGLQQYCASEAQK